MKPSKGVPELGIQLPEVFGGGVRDVVFHLGPDELIGIEFWGVGREAVNAQAGVTASEGLYVVTLVNRPAIPEQFDGPAEMAKESAEKHHDLRPGDVVGMQMHI